MKNENEFINDIWNKYELYSKNAVKDNFFNKNQYSYRKFILKVRTLISFIIIFIGSIGIVYAGTYTSKEIFQYMSSQKTETSINIEEYYKDMKLDDEGRYYTSILSYEDYNKIKNRFNNIINMNEEDFENNYLLIILLKNFEEANTYIDNVYCDDSNTYVILKDKKEEKNYDNNVVFAKLEKNLYKETLKISYEKDKPYSSEFVELEKLPSKYSKENAIADGCMVIYDNNIISSNLNQFTDFVNDVENNQMSFIRVVMIYNNSNNKIKESMHIIDVQYLNNEFVVGYDRTRTNEYIEENSISPYKYYSSNGILKSKYYNERNLISYYIEKADDENIFSKDSSYNRIQLCGYIKK